MKPVEPSWVLPRLNESSDTTLAGAVADLRRHQPDPTELASLASRLALQGIAVTAPLAPAPSTSHAVWKKWAIAGGGAASGMALWLSLTAPTEQAQRQVDAKPEITVAAQPPAAPATGAATRGGASVGGATPAGGSANSPVNTAAGEPAPLAPHAAPRAETTVEHRGEEGSGALRPGRAVPAARKVVAPAINPATPPALEDPTTAPTEIELLRDARFALKESPGRALELTESHARAFPGGKLAQERELLAISALVALGRRTAALSRANHFERAFPASPYRKQIRELLR